MANATTLGTSVFATSSKSGRNTLRKSETLTPTVRPAFGVGKPPIWNAADGSIDMYYWYVGTAALARIGGKQWQLWERKLIDALVPTQRPDTDPFGYKGSWDPVGPWGPDGGRVYSTALMAMTLSTWAQVSRTGVRSR